VDRERELRDGLVEHLERTRALTSDAIRAAMLRVPRHAFIPDVPLDEAYADKALAIKERGGFAISSISQPSMIAQMLQLLDVHPGDSILEIGTGSGYNAALLSALTGPKGNVVSVDIEGDLIETARERLVKLDFVNVSVLHADALASLESVFKRIIVTARADDIDRTWWRLLSPGGSLVAPLDIGYGGERAFGFVREGDQMRSIGSSACAFIGLRGTQLEERGEFFFRNRHARYAAPPGPTTPISVIAIERENARPELLSEADVVIARPQTMFAISGAIF
jgi:protein-L-isoaspartate(D-aspartate) O-methyltransferase